MYALHAYTPADQKAVKAAAEKREERKEREKERASQKRKSAFERVVTNSLSSLGREASRSLIRGIMNTLKK